MKLQGLAILFVIIILPITIIIGEYANNEIEIFRKEQLYDSRLVTATHDSLKAFQINTFNDATSAIVDSKINSIEASINAFYNSIEVGFGLEGYSKKDLQSYIPALVYTMYDGYYIYSPYTNVAETAAGTNITINLDSGNIEHGLKPYVYYSCRYKRTGYTDIDVIINYSLDNYITVQGIIDGTPYYKSGYLVTIAPTVSDEGVYKSVSGQYYYNGMEILEEANLTDNLLEEDGSIQTYSYIKLNGTKYYWDVDEEYIFYVLGGKRIRQVSKVMDEVTYNKYVEEIQHNRSGINYYKSAYEFTEWINANLGELTPADAQVDENQQLRETPATNSRIFENNKIEYSGSNFNLHRKEVIRYSIESNLSVSIANFNNYTLSENDFQMPKLSELDWEVIENEISIISFLQGLNVGGKIYNGYSVVANSKTQEVIPEERICVVTNDGYYHKINDLHFEKTNFDPTTLVSAFLDLDMEIRKNAELGYYYTQKNYLGCYDSIVNQSNVDNTNDSIYEYLYNNKDEINDEVKKVYYTALGRERWGTYKIENPSDIVTILDMM